MTCVAGLIGADGAVWMGGDSAGVSDWDLMVRKDPKVFRLGDALVGFSTSFRMGQLVQYGLVLPPYDSSTDLFGYMVSEVVGALRKILREGGFLKKTEDREEGGIFLVALRGRLFRIDSDLQVGETTSGYDAIGCGAPYAIGALHAMEATGPDDPCKRLTMALEIAEAHSAGVRGPYHILTTLKAEVH